jgi:hypothetical protein
MFLEHEKYSKNHKNSRKLPRDRLNMNNPNKTFGAHEKDFRAF